MDLGVAERYVKMIIFFFRIRRNGLRRTTCWKSSCAIRYTNLSTLKNWKKILRFIIKEKASKLEDLDAVWAAQAEKHNAIVKNVHDLLAKSAWDFSPEQLDHLFGCFQVREENTARKNRLK